MICQPVELISTGYYAMSSLLVCFISLSRVEAQREVFHHVQQILSKLEFQVNIFKKFKNFPPNSPQIPSSTIGAMLSSALNGQIRARLGKIDQVIFVGNTYPDHPLHMAKYLLKMLNMNYFPSFAAFKWISVSTSRGRPYDSGLTWACQFQV